MNRLLPVILITFLGPGCQCSGTGIRGTPSLDGFSEGDCAPDAPVPTSHWILQAGGPDDEMALSAAQMLDGTIAVAGLAGSFSGEMDLWILHLDGEGAVLGQWMALEVTEDLAPVAAPLDDCGMLVAGVTEVDTSGGKDIWLARFEADGTGVWERNIGGPGDEHSPAVIQTRDGGYLLAAVTESFSASADMWIVKLEPDGETSWQIGMGGDGAEQTSGRGTLLEGGDGRLYVLAQSQSFSSMEWDAWVIALTADGSVRWQEAIGVSGSGSTTGSALAMSGGDLYIAGQTDQSPHPSCAAWVVRMSTEGEIAWQKAYASAGCDAATGIVPRTGGVIVEGNADTSGSGSYDMWLASIDEDGTIAWQRNIGTPGGLELGMSLDRHRDGLLLLGRSVVTGGAGHHDLLVARLGEDGAIDGTCGLMGDGASSAEDSTATVLATDAAAVATTGEVRSVHLTFDGADLPWETLCPE